MKRRDKVLKRIGMAFLTVLMFFSLSSYIPLASNKNALDNTYYFLEERYDNLLLSEEDLKKLKKYFRKKNRNSRKFLRMLDAKIKKLCEKHRLEDSRKNITTLEKYGLSGESVGIYSENNSVMLLDYREKEVYAWID
jgi:Skp family chaperone for outer membrane proteins